MANANKVRNPPVAFNHLFSSSYTLGDSVKLLLTGLTGSYAISAIKTLSSGFPNILYTNPDPSIMSAIATDGTALARVATSAMALYLLFRQTQKKASVSTPAVFLPIAVCAFTILPLAWGRITHAEAAPLNNKAPIMAPIRKASDMFHLA